MLLGLVPLAFASAIVRYRLMDVEVIIKRALVYSAALAAIAAIYGILLTLATKVFLGGNDSRTGVIALLATMVVVLLSRPVKNAIQTGLDRVYYRDRYDYRRALVGFARDLNSDLDLFRLSERLVHRITETLVIERMALLLAPITGGRDGEFVTIAHIGFAGDPPSLARASDVGTRLISGHTLTLDDPLSQRRLDAREVEFWRDAGIHYFVPCVSKEGTIAVMALGRRASNEPLSSEDMALLSAVAAQAATALENGRLYRQLRVKADELERMREFSENILESLNDGLAVVNRDDQVVRWNRQLEELYGIRHEAAVGRRLDQIFEPAFLEVLRSARRESPEGAAFYRVPLRTAARTVTPPAGERGHHAASRLGRRDRRHDRHHRGHLGARAARGAAPDLREDGVDRVARGGRCARGEHAAHGHLELHPDAAPGRRTGRSEDEGAREDRAADLPRGEDRQRPPESVATGAGR